LFYPKAFAMKASNAPSLSVKDFLSLFEMFSSQERMTIASSIQQKTLAQRWDALGKRLPDTGISEDEVMEEVKAVRSRRYGRG